MKSGIFDINGIEIEAGQNVKTNSPLHKVLDVTFEDGAFCLRVLKTTTFRNAVTIRDAMAEARKHGKELKLEVIK